MVTSDAQILVIADDFDGNIVRIDHAAESCKFLGADIAVFPETALLG
jgi:predicted amidohydrolase